MTSAVVITKSVSNYYFMNKGTPLLSLEELIISKEIRIVVSQLAMIYCMVANAEMTESDYKNLLYVYYYLVKSEEVIPFQDKLIKSKRLIQHIQEYNDMKYITTMLLNGEDAISYIESIACTKNITNFKHSQSKNKVKHKIAIF